MSLSFGTDSAQQRHIGFVAGRYRDGAVSDRWTEVERCAERTFVSFVPACTCGWTGTDRAATPAGIVACRRAWQTGHGAGLPAPRPADRTEARSSLWS